MQLDEPPNYSHCYRAGQVPRTLLSLTSVSIASIHHIVYVTYHSVLELSGDDKIFIEII